MTIEEKLTESIKAVEQMNKIVQVMHTLLKEVIAERDIALDFIQAMQAEVKEA